MYQQFFGFKEPPFNLTPDSKFLFLSHRHQEALAAMLFGVQERKGFICLTGEIGCGKTTLCRALLSQLDPEQVKVCMVLNSYLTDLELLKTINEGFGLRSDSESKKTLLDALNEYLVEAFALGHNVVLVIDEAQNLRTETLEQIRMISNLETETDKLIQIMLIGQPELRRTLALPELEQLNQRITVRYHIQPLEEKEISDYIRHRLSVAEPQVEIEFTTQSFRLIHHYSRGVPRRINVICDRCLLIAYTQGTFTIDDKIVQQAVDEVRGETHGHGPVSTATGAARSGGFGRGLSILAKLVAGACVIAGGVYLGNLMSQSRPAADDTRVAANDERRPKVPAESPTPTPTPDLSMVQATATATPTVSPSATPTPVPTPIRYDDWQFDKERNLRVGDDRLSEAASYINLMSLWNIEIDLSTFRETPAAEVARFDLLAMVRGEPLSFLAFQTDKLGEALRPDLPVIVRLVPGDQNAGWAIVSQMGGEILTLVDPIHGKTTVRRSQLEPKVRQAIVLFRDPVGLTGAEPGDSNDRVKALQDWLVREGYSEAEADGKFGPQTTEALRRFQKKMGLEPTGRLDAVTTAAICAQLTPRRPRLFT
jgi:general secretion pathway protein A